MMSYGKTFCLIALIGLLLVTPFSLAAASGDAVTQEVRYGTEGKRIQITREGTDTWTAKEGPVVLSVKKGPGSLFTLLEGGATVASGRLEFGKLKLMTGDKKLYAEVKLKDERIRVNLSNDPTASWDIKPKVDNQRGALGFEVVREGDMAGKVKYHPEEKKLKAKDVREQTIAELRPASALSTAPAVFLMSNLQGNQRTLIMLVLMAMGK